MKIRILARLLSILFFLPILPVQGIAADAVTDKILVEGALKEGNLVIYADIGKDRGDRLVQEFSSLYPGIKVYLLDMSGTEVFNTHMTDLGRKRRVADILWSSEVELQAALVKDGYAAQYGSREKAAILHWADFGDLAYATSYEPVAMVYNRKFLAQKDIPASHGELGKPGVLARLKGKIATVDPEKNGRAFSFLAHDQTAGIDFWQLVRGFGRSELHVSPGYEALLDRVAAGDALFGYNVPANEALRRAKKDPSIGFFYPGDYTLAIARTMLMSSHAPHPDAARLWIDFVLSKRGQDIIAQGGDSLPVRGDVAGGDIAVDTLKNPANRVLKPMMPAPEITRFNERGIRKGFVLRWKQMLGVVK